MYHLDDEGGQLVPIDQRLFSALKSWFEIPGHIAFDAGGTFVKPIQGLQAMLIQNKSFWDLFEQLAATSFGKPGYYRLRLLSVDDSVVCSFMNAGHGNVRLYILPSNFVLVYNKTKPEEEREETSITEPT